MDPDLLREWRRWAAAEREGRDDAADEALRAAFRAIPARAPRPEFTGGVMRAVGQAAVRQARLARAAAVASGLFGVLVAIVGLLQLPWVIQTAVDLSVRAVLWTVVAVERGLDVWGILAQIGGTVAAVIAAPEVTFVLVGVGLVAAAALYGLQRILEFEERSSS